MQVLLDFLHQYGNLIAIIVLSITVIYQGKTIKNLIETNKSHYDRTTRLGEIVSNIVNETMSLSEAVGETFRDISNEVDKQNEAIYQNQDNIRSMREYMHRSNKSIRRAIFRKKYL